MRFQWAGGRNKEIETVVETRDMRILLGTVSLAGLTAFSGRAMAQTIDTLTVCSPMSAANAR